MTGYITYGITLVFYASVFPRLARNTQRTKDARAALDRGEINSSDYETVEMLERNRLSSISTAHSNCGSSPSYRMTSQTDGLTGLVGGYLITLALNLAILLPLASNPNVDQVSICIRSQKVRN